MRDRGLGSWLRRRARAAPSAPALVFGDRTWSNTELATDTAAVSAWLKLHGVRSGDRVAYMGANHPDFLRTALATVALGAVFVPLDPRRSGEQLRFILDDAGCGWLIHGPESAGIVRDLRDRTAVGQVLLSDAIPSAERPIADAPPAAIDLPVDMDDLCFLFYTSGTTGPPKGAMLTHGNLTWNVVNFLSVSDFRPDDVTLALAPLHRAGGWGVTLLPTLFVGGSVVLAPDRDPDRCLRLIDAHRVTTLFGGPDLLAALAAADTWGTADLSSLRLVISGGDTVPEPLIRRYADRGLLLLQGYGLSEAGPMALMLDAGDAVRKLGSAGLPPLLTDAQVLRDDGTEAASCESGELVVRGPNVMRGYWNRPAETEDALRGGWLHTGDAAYRDDEGFFYIVGRLGDAYVSAGTRVYPGEVEKVLVDHPAVREAGVVGVPDERLGTAGAAFVVLESGMSAQPRGLLDFCATRLPGDKVPVWLRFRESLPRNPAGKLLRAELREELRTGPQADDPD